jgi:high-affinity iron transporter
MRPARWLLMSSKAATCCNRACMKPRHSALTNAEALDLWAAPLPLPVDIHPDDCRALLNLRNQLVGLLLCLCGEFIDLRTIYLNLESARRQFAQFDNRTPLLRGVDIALALQRLGANRTQRDEVSRLLAKEYVIWQITRAREKADALLRLVQEGHATPALLYARASEIQALSNLPGSLLQLATGSPASKNEQSERDFAALLAAAHENSDAVAKVAVAWRLSLEAGYPNLLSAEEVERRDRIVLKLLRLIPKEYQSGVRDGEVTIPIEFREAKSLTIKTQQIVNELMPVWRETKTQALEKYGPELLATLENLESAIERKTAQSEVDSIVDKGANLLQRDFGLALKRSGMASDVVAETALEIRSLLGQSLAAAQSKRWRKAEQLRLDAYINFDLEIESRALPRDPALALRAEKTFLDGHDRKPGIKGGFGC